MWLERHVGGVVGAHEEVRARTGESLHAHRKGCSDRDVVPGIPRGQAACHGDAVHGYIRVFTQPEVFTKPFLAEGSETERGAFCAVRENAKVLHDGPSDVMTDPRSLVHHVADDIGGMPVVEHRVQPGDPTVVTATWGDTR
jgi:hypothetical protein